MIYAHHDASHNFLAADAYADNVLRDEIVGDELNRIIIDKKHKVVDAVRAIGINVPYDVSNIRLLDIIASNVADEPKLRDRLVGLILANSTETGNIKKAVQYHNATGKASYNFSDDELSAVGDTAAEVGKSIATNPDVQNALGGLVAAGLTSLSDKATSSKTNGATNLEIQKDRLRTAEMNSLTTPTATTKKLPTFLVWTLVGVGLIGLAFVTYKIVKSASSGSASAPDAAASPTQTVGIEQPQ